MEYLPYVEYVEQLIAERRRQEGIRKAEINRLLYEAGVMRPRPISRLWYRGLNRLGHLLVIAGEWLECHSGPCMTWETVSQPHRMPC